MTTEQGDVAVIREALEIAKSYDLAPFERKMVAVAVAALDRLAAAIASRDAALGMQRSAWGRNIREREAAEAALERAERERELLIAENAQRAEMVRRESSHAKAAECRAAQAVAERQKWQVEAQATECRVAEMRAALDFYAARHRYHSECCGTCINNDGGSIARAALDPALCRHGYDLTQADDCSECRAVEALSEGSMENWCRKCGVYGCEHVFPGAARPEVSP